MRWPVEEPLGTRFRVAFGIWMQKQKHKAFAVKFTDRKVLSIRTKQPLSGLLSVKLVTLCTLNFEKLLNRHECSNLYMMLCIT